MDTLSQVMRRLDAQGWDTQFEVRDGAVYCVRCDHGAPPEEYVVDEIARFEGASDPGDSATVYALTSPCGHRGTLVTAFGPDVDPAVGDVVRRLGDSGSSTA